jgi:RsiW-degrading membrane proteinase PrsW (M82 family)
LRLSPLIAIEAVAFLLIIGETYLFFVVIVPIGTVPHNFREYTVFAVLKIILTLGLGVLWFLVMLAMTRFYVRSKLKTPIPRPSS